MLVTELQNEINHLVFLYFTSIGVLQRDSKHEEVSQNIRDLQAELRECFKRILTILEDDEKIEMLHKDSEEIIAKSKQYLDEGFAFLDSIIDLDN
jgi:hypothetical protein